MDKSLQALIAVLKVLRIGMAIAAFLGAGAFYDLAPLTQRCFPIGAYYLLDGCVHWVRALASESWPVVSGEVLSSGVEWTISYAGKFLLPEGVVTSRGTPSKTMPSRQQRQATVQKPLRAP